MITKGALHLFAFPMQANSGRKYALNKRIARSLGVRGDFQVDLLFADLRFDADQDIQFGAEADRIGNHEQVDVPALQVIAGARPKKVDIGCWVFRKDCRKNSLLLA